MFEKYKAVLWDVDGTLLDTIELHAKGTKYAMERLGFKFTDEDVKRFIELEGLRFFDIMKRLRPELDMETLREIRRLKNEYVAEHINEAKIKVPPSLIHSLAGEGKLMGVVSSGARVTVMRVLEMLGIKDLMRVIITADDVTNGKPDPEGLLKALEMMGNPSPAVYVGDRDYDRTAAENAGIDFIHVDEVLRRWK